MIRRIIKIDKDKCNGCEECVKTCHEGAIVMVSGKASIIRDDYCDGLGDCLPVCTTGAITFETRNTLAYDKGAQEKYLESQKHLGCPGSSIKSMKQSKSSSCNCDSGEKYNLGNWPIQIKLMPVNALYLNNAHLLIAADCTAFAYPNFSSITKDKITAIACPKLDSSDIEKLTLIFQNNDIKKITMVRMSLPCCGGIVYQVNESIKAANKNIDISVITISPGGSIIKD